MSSVLLLSYRDACCFPLLFLCAFVAEHKIPIPSLKMLIVSQVLCPGPGKIEKDLWGHVSHSCLKCSTSLSHVAVYGAGAFRDVWKSGKWDTAV